MKRQLTRKEKQLTEKNLKRRKEELKDIEESLKYNNAVLEKRKQQYEFEDEWRGYLRKQKMREDQKIIEMIELKKKELEFTIKTTQNQLKEGVNQPTGT